MGDFRACEGAECGDASADAGDAGDAVAPTACGTSADCVAADAGVICSAGACATIQRVARGISDYECVVLSDGTARCWGRDAEGQLGTGQIHQTSVATPQTVLLGDGGAPMTGIVDVSLGYGFACAWRSDDSVWCWGTAAGAGSLVPQLVNLGNVKVQSISASEDSACALVTRSGQNEVDCWGGNDNGHLGCTNATTCESSQPLPSTIPTSAPRTLTSAQPPLYLANGTTALCIGFSESHALDCFGGDPWGDLGDGRTLTSSCCLESTATDAGTTPSLPWNVKRLEGSVYNTFAEDENGTWYGWGASLGEGCTLLMNGCNDLLVPTQIDIGRYILDLSPGWRHACGATADGVYCWGQDDHGQVGNGGKSSANQPPTRVSLPTSAVPVNGLAAHRHWTCAKGADEQLYCWGQNGDQTDPTPWLGGANSPSADFLSPKVVRWD